MLYFINYIKHCYVNINNIYYNKRLSLRKTEHILTFKYFKISFNKTLNLCNYGLYYLEEFDTKNKHKYIKNKIKYNGLPYDNGHMIPRSNIRDGSVNIMANIVPQYKNFNQGIWRNIEEYVKKKYTNNYVLTCPEYNYSNYIIINNTNIYIPTGFYKIVFDKKFKILYNIFLIHNNDKDYNFTNNIDYIKLPWFITIK
jgi:DNA/RNA endonuclease G (NUC1)